MLRADRGRPASATPAGCCVPGSDALMLYTDGMVETRAGPTSGIGIDQPDRPGRPQAPQRLRRRRGHAGRLGRQPGRRPGPAPALARLSSPLGRSSAGSMTRSSATAVWERGRAVWHHDPRVSRGRGRRRTPVTVRGRSSMVEPQSSKLMTRVRFPSSARRWFRGTPGAPQRGVASWLARLLSGASRELVLSPRRQSPWARRSAPRPCRTRDADVAPEAAGPVSVRWAIPTALLGDASGRAASGTNTPNRPWCRCRRTVPRARRDTPRIRGETVKSAVETLGPTGPS